MRTTLAATVLGLFALSGGTTVANAEPLSLRACEEHSAHPQIELSQVAVEPVRPVRGDDFNVVVNGAVEPGFSFASKPTIVVEVRLHGVLLGHTKMQLCREDQSDLPGCISPDSNGVFSNSVVFQLGDKIPSDGGVTVDAKIVSSLDRVISCVYGRTEIRKDNQVVSASSPSTGYTTDEYNTLYKLWFEEHKENIPEFGQSLDQFKQNLDSIRVHNLGKEEPPFLMAMNQFGALSQSEFARVYTGFRRDMLKKPVPEKKLDANVSRRLGKSTADLPKSVDWVPKGAVTPVKNQGACGSCWSFATTGALEGAYFLKTGVLKSFSEQELVNCDRVDQGCNGGLMDNAFEWIEEHGGLCTEEDVPYRGRAARCDKSCKPVPGSAPKRFVDVKHNEESLMETVVQQPVAVAIEADQLAFQFYSRGVLTGRCSTTLDHGVLTVGYGTSSRGVDYWKVKNSWGASWGSHGYILLQRGKHQSGGECGILLSASVPEY